MEEDANRASLERHDQKRQSFGNSFRLKKTPRASGGFPNPAYVGEPGLQSPPINDESDMSDGYAVPFSYNNRNAPRERKNSFKPDGYDKPSKPLRPILKASRPNDLRAPLHMTDAPYTINLGYAPGETEDGTYSNPGYSMDDSAETNFMNSSGQQLGSHGDNVSDEVLRRRRLADPMQRASSQISDQPGLAGFGALANVDGRETSQVEAIPKLRKEVRLAVRTPSFEPVVPWEFPHSKLFVRMKIGDGSFGEVWRAQAEGILGRPGRMVVAVKMLKGKILS